jgi:glucose/arabinose dehydrogenase
MKRTSRPLARGTLFLEPLEDRLVPSTLPPGFAETPLVSGLTLPTSMEFAPDGRLFVTEQAGTLRIIQNGSLLPTPFLTLTVSSAGERGLLGVTLDPAFAVNHFVYVYYTTATSPIHNRISRFTANGNVAVPGSEVDLFDLTPLSAATNHNGGGLHFGTDGKLYAGVGENGTPSNSQTLANVLGKVLRINPDGTIPSDNPFFTTATGNNCAIWALGLRNPFTFAVQPGTGRIFINDVGQNTWEEINDGKAGANYGWPVVEGVGNNPSYVDPIYAYNHDAMSSAITGGVFYQATQFPAAYQGQYFFSDYLRGFIRVLNVSTHQASDFATGVPGSVDLDVGPDGALYYLSITNGTVYRIQSNINANQAYVAGLYRDLLLRPPDAAGLSFWAGQVNQGVSRFQVALWFEASTEYRVLQVQGLYQRYLHRAADAGGLANAVAFLQAGGTVEQVAAALAGSPEYYQNRGGGTNDGFLNALYQDVLRRSPDPAGRALFDQQLANHVSTAAIATDLLVSAEYDADTVEDDYGLFLHRAADATGLSTFTNMLQQGTRDEIVSAFILASDEYYARQ